MTEVRELAYSGGFAVDTGPVAAPPLVFLHGGLATHLTSLRAVGALAARGACRVIAPDLRGSGRSHDRGPLAWAQLADDVVALLDHLGIAAAAIGGVSFGAGVAVAAALAHPTRVRALAIVWPAFAGGDVPLTPAQAAAMRAMAEAGARALRDGMAAFDPLVATLPAALQDGVRALFATYDPASVAASTAFMDAGVQPFADGDALRAIRVPTLVIPGRDDTHPREVAARYASRIAGATVVEADEPALADAIGAFLASA